MLRIKVMLFGVASSLRQRHFPLAEFADPLHRSNRHSVLQHVAPADRLQSCERPFECQRHHIHRANMAMEQVIFIGALATDFGIKVQATG